MFIKLYIITFLVSGRAVAGAAQRDGCVACGAEWALPRLRSATYYVVHVSSPAGL